MTPDERDRLVRVETEIEVMKPDVKEIKEDLKKLLLTVQQARGGWAMISVLLGAGAMIGAILDWVFRVMSAFGKH